MRSTRGLRTAIFLAVLTAPGAARASNAEEVPYVQTPDNVTLAMLEAAGVGPGDYVIDLGSGDGRIVILAAKRFGARGLGVEIVPSLVAESRVNAQRAGVAGRAEFREQDLFKTDLSHATVITMYLMPEVNMQLRDPILQLKPGTRIVSHDWNMGSWKPDRTVLVDAPDKPVGLEKASRVHYWVVPARIAGTWCAGKRRLVIAQEFQKVRINGREGHIAGTAVYLSGLTLDLEGEELKVRLATGSFKPLQLLTFRRAPGQPDSCPAR